MTDLVRERLKSLPDRPGCYLMRDRQGEIIYVGKAKNLKNRVRSYFRSGASHSPKVRSMVQTVWDFEFITVKNEAEALLTEASLIKKYKPHFNILMRDDKRYLALRADRSVPFPRFTCVRIIRDDGARYFGPFPSSPVVREAKDFVEKHYGIRSCNAVLLDETVHKHCLADIIRTCSAPCLGHISSDDYLMRFDEACEFLSGNRPEVLEEMKSKMSEAASKGDYESAARFRDTYFALKEMTKSHFTRKSPQMRRDDAMLGIAELAQVIGLDSPPRIIECVDISNLFGQHNVASLVVARDGLPDKRFYRHFKIKTFEGADDPRAMAEVARRRYGPDSTVAPRLPKADLYICDGGVTQLRAARAVFAQLGINDIPTIGLAESQEIIVLDDGRPDVYLPRDSQALMVITRLRDEAHRFALSYHRRLRDKTIRESVLDEVPGIGAAKKMKLLKAFKSVYGIARATAAEISSVAGISESLANEVLRTVFSVARKGGV